MQPTFPSGSFPDARSSFRRALQLSGFYFVKDFNPLIALLLLQFCPPVWGQGIVIPLADESRFTRVFPAQKPAVATDAFPDETRFSVIIPALKSAPPQFPDEIRFTPVYPAPSRADWNASELPLFPDETLLRTGLGAPLEMNHSTESPSIAMVLPPVPGSQSDGQSPEDGLSLFVKSFEITGNTVFPNIKLQAAVVKFSGRKITAEELEEARVDVTRMYVDAGYVNSGAILPDQDPSDGVVRMKVVEGTLTDIELSGNRWFRPFWLKSKLRKAAGTPVNIHQLRNGLQLLRENPSIAQINAELKPGAKPGESILHAAVKDTQPFRLDLEVSNKRPPSVGEGAAEFHFADLNLLGMNDPLDLRWGALHGTTDGSPKYADFDNASASYEIPLGPWDTAFGVRASKNDSTVLDQKFAALDIKSRSDVFGVSITQPLIRSLSQSLSLGISADRKHTETFLMGAPFTLAPGAIDGKTDVFVTHLSIDWTRRTQRDVLALRGAVNFGLPAMGATRAVSPADGQGNAVPDGKYTSWLGQAQYMRRIFDTSEFRREENLLSAQLLRETLLILRGNVQLSNDALLSSEQFSIGGAQSVRGYRENQILRDNGIFASCELRIPVWLTKDRTPAVSVATFFDYGQGWDSRKMDSGLQELCSIGLGVLFDVSKRARATVYCGHHLIEVQKTRESLQDYGIHFTLSLSAF
ncbi:MAG: ShlB/FhaC/HecB family hemolysin secretion/activation protein [Verrucomicrobia bacterium]|nr:ShlB/FhaC/HecB family hemolysin secretion/activation protein [Verrucomicrobiota bacterium]